MGSIKKAVNPVSTNTSTYREIGRKERMSLTYGSLVDPPALLLNGCGRSHRVTPESLLKRMKPAAMAFERTATIRNENKDDREKRKEDGAVGGRAAFPLPARVSTALIARSAIAVVALGFIDAGYSGDWSRIGVISRETEEVLRQAAYFVVPLCLYLIFKFSVEEETPSKNN
ncbi:uncharacterized protein LOC116257282 [Nymphaea colorata]|nr:uncharacterized protein LOC116257282 [Nymphaea colorata]